MAEVSPDNKEIARRVAQAFGGKPRVTAYWDDSHERSVDLLSCPDVPGPGLTAYSTVTLSDSPLIHKRREYPVRIELVGACGTEFEQFANVLVTAALFVMKDKWFCRPGVVFEQMISMYELSETMAHLYFTAPSQWPDLNTPLDLSTKRVTWLWGIPISEAESRLIAKHGDDHFESALEESGAALFDIHRPSII